MTGVAVWAVMLMCMSAWEITGCHSDQPPESHMWLDMPGTVNLGGGLPGLSKADMLSLLGIPDQVVVGPDRQVAWLYSRGGQAQALPYPHMVYFWDEDGQLLNYWYSSKDNLNQSVNVWAWSEVDANSPSDAASGWGDAPSLDEQ